MSILAGLDFYKLTMSQQAWRVAPNAQVTFTLKNRGNQFLVSRISPARLREALEPFENTPFSVADINYLRSLGIFEEDYLTYIFTSRLPKPHVYREGEYLRVEVTGSWPLVTFWETVVMSAINELWFSHEATYPEYRTDGHEILTNAIKTLRDREYITFSDFGTRRRFSQAWHREIVSRLAFELPEQFIGTSNPYFAREFGIKPIGTFAHEMPMVYAATADKFWKGRINPLLSHNAMLDDWFLVYGEDYSIALTDTFGTDFFFETFTQYQAEQWRGLRHDSGDPFAFALKAIEFYKSKGIDPLTKTLVFSDGLDLTDIIALAKFRDRINVTFGWGTGLTNNVGVAPLNIVMKATAVDGFGTVKLSDNKGKHTGTPENIARYLEYKKEFTS